MQRQTPQDSSLRAYQGGGCITCIPEIDDSKGIQETKGSRGMKGENWPSNISPQNYGFSSVVADATKSASGLIQQCAEGFMSFIGGNRNFPLCGVMDDRRHRLKDLAKDAAKGAVSMFGLKEWGQQLLNTEDGWFMTGNTQKKNRFQLVDNQNGKKQQGPQAGTKSFRSKSGVQFDIEVIGPLAANGGGAGGGNGGSGEVGGMATGQKTLHKEESKIWLEQNSKDTTSAHGDAYSSQRGGSDSSTYYKDRSFSCQSTSEHSHIRAEGNHIWVDKGACYSDMPLIIKKDPHCKD
jgi:phage gp45-like